MGVVTIDTESVEQIEVLVALFDGSFKTINDAQGGGGVKHVDMMQMALRAMSDPAFTYRPPEPTGIGSVVVDEAGKRWVRLDGGTPLTASWARERSSDIQNFWFAKGPRVLLWGIDE